MKLKDIYQLESPKLDAWHVNVSWFNGIRHLGELTASAAEAIESDGLLTIYQVAFHNVDGERFARVCALWWNKQPFMIVQNAGRSGSDHEETWITDGAAYKEAQAYLAQLLTKEDEPEVTDPDQDIYPDEVLAFYNHDFCKELGIKNPEPQQGLMILGAASNFMSASLPKHVLVMARAGVTPAAILRRGSYFLSHIRPLSAKELADNPRLMAGEETAAFYWYQECERVMSPDVMRI